MSLRKHSITEEIREIDETLIAKWEEAGNPKAMVWEPYVAPVIEPPAGAKPVTIKSSLLFDLLTKQERNAIRKSNDDDVQDFVFRLMVNPTFQSDSTNFTGGFTLLVQNGLLSVERASLLQQQLIAQSSP